MSSRLVPLAPRPAGALLLGLLGGLVGCARESSEVRPRHAILISIDTLRPDFLGCYGHPRPTSPTLDGLAAAGVRFEDVTAAAPWTLPSHATMLTGLYPASHGVKSHETRLPERIQTLAEEFQAHGFETIGVVNTHNVGAPQFQLRQGFARFGYVPEVMEDPLTLRLKTPNRGADVIARAKEMLAARDPAKPLFLFLHFYDTHTDFTPEEEFRRPFVEPYDGRIDGRSQQLHGYRNRGESLGEDDLRYLRQLYEAEIRQFDALLGEFLGWLREQGLHDEALLVVTSDHGEEFQEHGGVLHGRQQYQEVMRIPLILAGPGLPEGLVVSEPVHGIDVTPTVLACMGLASSTPRDGIDLSPAWRGGALPARTFFAEADHNNKIGRKYVTDIKKMIRKGNEKLMLDTHTQKVELYDLEADPLELKDLAAARPERVQALRAELERYLAGASTSDPVAPPTAEEQAKLDALGYGGDGDDK